MLYYQSQKNDYICTKYSKSRSWKMETIKQIPYGVADFESVMNRNLYYVDKTMYLAELEKQPDTLIFIRPRRFGKSFFISMMRAYYDKSKAKDFDTLFGSLWIGSHPTPLRNHYQVLYLDFSRILGNIDVLEEKFNSYCCDQLNDFIDIYRDTIPRRGLTSSCVPTMRDKNSICF